MSLWNRLPGLRPRKQEAWMLPAKSYELIKILDETIPQPEWPADVKTLLAMAKPARMYTTIWQAAQRALVDNLVNVVRQEIDFYDELESQADATADDATDEAPTDIDIRLGAAPTPMERGAP